MCLRDRTPIEHHTNGCRDRWRSVSHDARYHTNHHFLRRRAALSHQNLGTDPRAAKEIPGNGRRRAQRMDYVRATSHRIPPRDYALLVRRVSNGKVSVYMGQVQIAACTLPRRYVCARVYGKRLRITTEAIETTRRTTWHGGDDMPRVAGTSLRRWLGAARSSHSIWHRAHPIPGIATASSIGRSPNNRNYVCWYANLSRGLPGYTDRNRRMAS